MANGNGCGDNRSPVVIGGGQYVVHAQAVCEFPKSQPKTYTFNTCEPQIFMDCRKSAWFQHPYKNPMVCYEGQSVWSETDLQHCPSALYPLLYDECTGDFWFFEEGCAWKNKWNATNEEYLGWAQTCEQPPRTLAYVYINLSTGGFFYYPSCVCETMFRRNIPEHPFCTRGYQ